MSGKQGPGTAESRQSPLRPDQPERRSQTALPDRPAIKGRSTPARLAARFGAHPKCTSHFGFGFRNDAPIEQKLVRDEQGYVPTGTAHNTVISIGDPMQCNHPDSKQGDTRLALDRPLGAIGDGGRSSALIGSVGRAGDHDRVRADYSSAGSAAAMIVRGIVPEPATAPCRGASGNQAREQP